MQTALQVNTYNPGWGAFWFSAIALTVIAVLCILMAKAIFKWAIKTRDSSLERVLREWTKDEHKNQLP